MERKGLTICTLFILLFSFFTDEQKTPKNKQTKTRPTKNNKKLKTQTPPKNKTNNNNHENLTKRKTKQNKSTTTTKNNKQKTLQTNKPKKSPKAQLCHSACPVLYLGTTMIHTNSCNIFYRSYLEVQRHWVSCPCRNKQKPLFPASYSNSKVLSHTPYSSPKIVPSLWNVYSKIWQCVLDSHKAQSSNTTDPKSVNRASPQCCCCSQDLD